MIALNRCTRRGRRRRCNGTVTRRRYCQRLRQCIFLTSKLGLLQEQIGYTKVKHNQHSAVNDGRLLDTPPCSIQSEWDCSEMLSQTEERAAWNWCLYHTLEACLHVRRLAHWRDRYSFLDFLYDLVWTLELLRSFDEMKQNLTWRCCDETRHLKTNVSVGRDNACWDLAWPLAAAAARLLLKPPRRRRRRRWLL